MPQGSERSPLPAAAGNEIACAGRGL